MTKAGHVVSRHHCLDPGQPLLLQPSQAPPPLHTGLKIRISLVLRIERRQNREQV